MLEPCVWADFCCGAGERYALGRFTACSTTDWISDTSMRCLVQVGVGGSISAWATVAMRGAYVSGAMTYDAASPSVVLPTNTPATGSSSVTVLGSNMGQVSFSTQVRGGGTACESSGWLSDTSVQCRAGRQLMGSRALAVTAGARVGSMSVGFSAAATALSALKAANSPSTGSISVTVYGAGMGLGAYSATSRMGRTACEATTWASDTAMLALVGGGVMRSGQVSVTAGMLVGSLSSGFSVGRGVISLMRRSNVPTSGSVSITVYGAGAGHEAYTGVLRVGLTACQATIWQSDTSLVCQVGSRVMGSVLVSVSVGQQVGSMTSGVSADTGMMSVTGRRNTAATGSASITVFGAGLGSHGYTVMSRAGGTGCESTDWVSDT